jgi:glyoxylase-like metal-dependent hydrolase (beta-lactamase superfamily II)
MERGEESMCDQGIKFRPKPILLLVIVALAALPSVAFAQLQAGPLRVMKISDNFYWTVGGTGENTGIIVGSTGVIVVDTKTTEDSAKAVLGEIAKITNKPVDTVILTHSDHLRGLAALPAGVTIIAQENCKKEMEASRARDAAPADRMPTRTIGKDETLTIDGVRVRLLNFGPAHTAGDLTVYFPDLKAVFAGDLVVTDRAPDDTPIHEAMQGSVKGWFNNVRGMLALDATTYVLGHGESLFSKDDVKKKVALIQAKWDKIQALAKQGKSLTEIKAALGEPTAAPVPNAQGNLPEPTLTELIYKELKEKA